MPERRVPKAPTGLRAPGRALWKSVHAGLAAGFELDERETAILALAARQADDVAALERVLAADGVVVEGSQGQPRLNGIVAELRQGRLAVARLLGALELPDSAEQPRSVSSERARKAAHTRWAEHSARRAGSRG